MSQSKRPTSAPMCLSAQARLTEQVDLPTPPLPLATATIRFSPGILFCDDKGLCTDGDMAGWPAGIFTSPCTIWTSGRDFRTRSHAALICFALAGLEQVNCSVLLTAPWLAATFLTIPHDTMSHIKP